MKKNEIKISAYFVLCVLKQYDPSVKATHDSYSIIIGLNSIIGHLRCRRFSFYLKRAC